MYKMTKMLWHMGTLLGNDRGTNNETMIIAMQQLPKYAAVSKPLLGSGPRAAMKIPLEASEDSNVPVV
jgi:hypothetical protein